LSTRLTAVHRRPRTRPDDVARRRLIDVLERSDATVVSLEAPAGWGKTTLLAQWAEGRDDVAWISVTPELDDPIRFRFALVEALENIAAPTGDVDAESLHFWLTELVVDPPRSFHLVLDDFHLISDHAIHEALHQLVEVAGPSFQLLVGSRTRPPLRLARLQAQRRVLEIGPSVLAFTDEEAAELLGGTPGWNDRQAVGRLSERLGGWPVGLSLVRVGSEAPRRARFAGSAVEDYLTEYLEQEVLPGLPVELGRFLSEVSVLRILEPELCRSVTGEPATEALLREIWERRLSSPRSMARGRRSDCTGSSPRRSSAPSARTGGWRCTARRPIGTRPTTTATWPCTTPCRLATTTGLQSWSTPFSNGGWPPARPAVHSAG
jgi:LuxR family maltose regulon positive regulatory protein